MFENKTALIKKMVRAFYPFAKQYIGFNKPVRLFLRHDPQNAIDPLGKTAYYDPENWTITVYTVDRHPKDIVRSIAHELIHHKQNCDGRLTNIATDNITEDSHLKQIEEEAYRDGNSCFRSWEDDYKASKKDTEKVLENKMNEKNEGEYSGDITENDTVKEYYVKRADKVAEQVANRFGFKFVFNLNNDQEGGEQK
jgi:hypothetical protein